MGEESAYANKAKQIIADNSYMVIATVSSEGKPWAAPVFFAFDSKYANIYFISATDSRHAENIEANPNVALAIYNSTSSIDISDGVQIEGTAYAVEKEGINEAVKLYSLRLSDKAKQPEKYDPNQYLEPAEFRFFNVKVQKIYVTGTDRRVEVELGE